MRMPIPSSRMSNRLLASGIAAAIAIATPMAVLAAPHDDERIDDTYATQDRSKDAMHDGTPYARNLSEQDKDFLRAAVVENRKAIALSSVVQEQGENAMVQSLAEEIERDHIDLTQKIKDRTGMSFQGASADSAGLGSAVGQNLRTQNDEHRVALAAMQGMSGEQLDRQYLSTLDEVQGEAIERFEAARDNENLSEFSREIARELVADLREHEQMLEAAQNSFAQN